MLNQRTVVFAALLFVAGSAVGQGWEDVGPGVRYRHFVEPGIDVHVTRIDLTNDDIRVIATRESERGTRVSEYAKKNKALAAINADYFNDKFQPIGLAIGPCGRWEGTKDTGREGVIAIGEERARIDKQSEVMEPPEEWIEQAVSGWPMLVSSCAKVKEIPGSKAFSGSPHPRSAVGVSKSGKTLYLVVADGRREDAPGMTLGDLADFMLEKLKVCSAMNLDGGGSSAMWLTDRIVNRPSDGSERKVTNHLAVVRAEDYSGCDVPAMTASTPATSTDVTTTATTSAPQ